MAARSTSEWITQVLIESVLIVVSILVALGLDEWRDERQDREVVRKALSNFLIEIEQNRNRVEDAAPFNLGLHSVLSSHYMDDDLESVDEFVYMIESYSPAVLQSTAWDTALATGSLAKLDYNIVTALSLTYSLQARYQLATRARTGDLTSPQILLDGRIRLALHNSIRFLDEVIALEAEMVGTYIEAAAVIEAAIDSLPHASWRGAQPVSP